MEIPVTIRLFGTIVPIGVWCPIITVIHCTTEQQLCFQHGSFYSWSLISPAKCFYKGTLKTWHRKIMSCVCLVHLNSLWGMTDTIAYKCSTLMAHVNIVENGYSGQNSCFLGTLLIGPDPMTRIFSLEKYHTQFFLQLKSAQTRGIDYYIYSVALI